MIVIVIPNYNQGKYCQQCFDSILEQDLQPDEVIIVDDKSTDDSISLIEEQLVAHPTWKLIKHESNKGLPATRNTGIKNSESDFVVCLDLDDLLAHNYLSSCTNTIQLYDVDIVYCNSVEFGAKQGEIKFPEFDEAILRQRNFINCSAMFRRQVWEKSPYDEIFIESLEDYEFWISAHLNGFTFKKNLHSALLYRRTESSMADNTDAEMMKRNKIRFRVKHKDFINWTYA